MSFRISLGDRFGLEFCTCEWLLPNFVVDWNGHLCREPIYVEIRVSSDRLAHQHWRLGVHRFGEVDIISAAD